MQALPAVRAAAHELEQGGMDVLLLNIHEGPGSELLERFGFRTSPTYLLFDGAGQEVLRSSSLPSAAELLAAGP